MQMSFTAASVVVAIGLMTNAQTKSDQAPSGTVVDQQHADSNEVQPAPKKVRITPDVVRAAQEKLSEDGYKPGTPDGKMGPSTRAAIRLYQEHEGLKTTATLDESTLSHLGVGGGKIAATAPGDIGRGAKAAAHDIKEGHPIAAGKAMGKGVGRAGKAIGESTESGVKGAKHKVAGKKSDESTPQRPQ
jgi:peptidoglycan hydrolase-like protein with peptidoglycan-binding domain